MLFQVTADHRSRFRQRLALSYYISYADRQVSNRVTMDHVTEINQANNPVVTHNNIVVIRVAVNNAATQVFLNRGTICGKTFSKSFDEPPQFVVGDQANMIR